MTNEADLHAVSAWLTECARPLLISHRRPDGDALGAMAAMSLALQRLGKEPAAALFEPLPKRYDLLASSAPWRQWDETREILAADCDSVVILDTCALTQLEPIADYLARAPRTLVIDHHATRDTIGTRAGDLRVFDETAGAACLIVAEWVRAAGITIDQPLATALFIGIATDTGWFRFNSTDARTMRIGAELLAAGADAAGIYRQLYEREPHAKLRLIARVLEKLELHADGRLAVMKLRPADFAAVGASVEMTEDLVNEAGRLASAEATILFTEESDGVVRVNFRSKRVLDVSQLARRYGGGGHVRAAGARPNGKWDDLVPRVIAETIEALEALKD